MGEVVGRCDATIGHEEAPHIELSLLGKAVKDCWFSIPNHYLYSGMVIHTLDMFYEVQVVDDKQPMANDDVAKLQWIPLEQVNPKDFGLNSISQGVTKYLAESLRK